MIFVWREISVNWLKLGILKCFVWWIKMVKNKLYNKERKIEMDWYENIKIIMGRIFRLIVVGFCLVNVSLKFV